MRCRKLVFRMLSNVVRACELECDIGSVAVCLCQVQGGLHTRPVSVFPHSLQALAGLALETVREDAVFTAAVEATGAGRAVRTQKAAPIHIRCHSESKQLVLALCRRIWFQTLASYQGQVSPCRMQPFSFIPKSI